MNSSDIEIVSLEEIDRREQQYQEARSLHEEALKEIPELKDRLYLIEIYLNNRCTDIDLFPDPQSAFHELISMNGKVRQYVEYLQTDIPNYIDSLCSLANWNWRDKEMSNLALISIMNMINDDYGYYTFISLFDNSEILPITISNAEAYVRERFIKALYDCSEKFSNEFFKNKVDYIVTMSARRILNLEDTNRVSECVRLVRFISTLGIGEEFIIELLNEVKKSRVLMFVSPSDHASLVSLLSLQIPEGIKVEALYSHN